MTRPPSTTGDDGRVAGGRFGPGNKYAKGNPHARRVARLRAELLRTVTPAGLREVVRALLNQAKSGDVAAAKELLQRLLGPPVELDLLERLGAWRRSSRRSWRGRRDDSTAAYRFGKGAPSADRRALHDVLGAPGVRSHRLPPTGVLRPIETYRDRFTDDCRCRRCGATAITIGTPLTCDVSASCTCAPQGQAAGTGPT